MAFPLQLILVGNQLNQCQELCLSWRGWREWCFGMECLHSPRLFPTSFSSRPNCMCKHHSVFYSDGILCSNQIPITCALFPIQISLVSNRFDLAEPVLGFFWESKAKTTRPLPIVTKRDYVEAMSAEITWKLERLTFLAWELILIPVYSEIPSGYFYPPGIFSFPIDRWQVLCLLVADLQGLACVPLRMSCWSKWKSFALSGNLWKRKDSSCACLVNVYNLREILSDMGSSIRKRVSSMGESGGGRDNNAW